MGGYIEMNGWLTRNIPPTKKKKEKKEQRLKTQRRDRKRYRSEGEKCGGGPYHGGSWQEGVAEAIRALISEKKISAAGVILFLSLSIFSFSVYCSFGLFIFLSQFCCLCTSQVLLKVV